MSKSIPTGYILPPGNLREKFWASESRPPRQFFCLIPCPGAKSDDRIPRGGAKFSKTGRNCLQKVLKKIKKTTRQYKFFLDNLTKPLYFKLKQNHSKVFKYSSLDTVILGVATPQININCSVCDTWLQFRSFNTGFYPIDLNHFALLLWRTLSYILRFRNQ